MLNPGFEDATNTVWTFSGGGGAPSVGISNASPRTGLKDALLVTRFSTIGDMKQTLTTIAGGIYTLDYWVRSSSSLGTPSSTALFEVLWNNSIVTGSVLAGVFPNGTTVVNVNYFHFIFTGLAATGTATVLDFRFNKNGGGGTSDPNWRVDDVGVNLTSVVVAAPEPCSLLLVGGFLASGAAIRRFKRR